MSFLSILKTVGKVALAAEHIIALGAEMILPAYAAPIAAVDGLLQNVQAAIITKEIQNPVDGQGQLKAAAVTQDFNSMLSLAQEALAIGGKTISYDPTKLQAVIDAQTAAYNNWAALKGTFKIVDVPKPQ